MFVIADLKMLAELWHKITKMKLLIITIFAFTMNISTKAQEKWILKSENLAKPDTVLIFKPENYTATEKYPVVYLLHGYSENYEQWSKTTDLQKLANQYGFIIITPDGFTSYYVNSLTDTGSQWKVSFSMNLRQKYNSQ